MDRLDSLAFFIRVVEKGGVAKAGRDFGLSPASASDWLSALEAHYGTTLLHRTTRSIGLTDEGRVLVERARHLVAEATDLEIRIKEGAESLSGPIRISAPQDLGERCIAPLVDRFIDAHPGVSLELQLLDGYVDIVGQGMDLAIRLGSLKDSSLIARRVGDARRVVCAAPSYLAEHGEPTHPDMLVDHNCLVMQFGLHTDRDWPFKIKGQHRIVRVSGNRIANSGTQVHRWCRDGRGLALKSIWDVREALQKGQLVEVLADYAPDSAPALQLVYPGGRKPSRRVQALIDFLESELQIVSTSKD